MTELDTHVDVSGSRREALEAIRDRLVEELNSTTEDGRTLVQITRELRATLAELDALPTGKGVSAVDEVAERRARRRASAAAAPGS